MSGFISIGDGCYINLRLATEIRKTSEKSKYGTPVWRAFFDTRDDVRFCAIEDHVVRALSDITPAEPGSRLHELWYQHDGKTWIHTYQIVAWMLRPDQTEPHPITPEGLHDNYDNSGMVLVELPNGKLRPITSDVVFYDNLEQAIAAHVEDCHAEQAHAPLGSAEK